MDLGPSRSLTSIDKDQILEGEGCYQMMSIIGSFLCQRFPVFYPHPTLHRVCEFTMRRGTGGVPSRLSRSQSPRKSDPGIRPMPLSRPFGKIIPPIAREGWMNFTGFKTPWPKLVWTS